MDSNGAHGNVGDRHLEESSAAYARASEALQQAKAVIFDFDGVLVDSEPLHEWAIRTSVRDRGWSFTAQQFVEHIVGRGDDHAYRCIAKWNGGSISEAEIHDILREKWRLMSDGIAADKFTVQPGAVQLVRLIAETLPTAVCSGSVASTVRPMLERIGAAQFMRAVVCGDDVPHMKPAPDGYLLAAAKLDVAPEHCVAIEDTPTGVRAAKRAGFFAIGVGHTVPLHMLHQADVAVPTIKGLAERVEGLRST